VLFSIRLTVPVMKCGTVLLALMFSAISKEPRDFAFKNYGTEDAQHSFETSGNTGPTDRHVTYMNPQQ
jgi:hypothetical protein